MKSFRAAVLIAAWAFGAFSIAQDSPPGGSVEGIVINSATGAGIGGASVVLSTLPARGGRPARYPATSDIAGRFRITGVPAGTYRASAEKDGFAQLVLDINALLNSGFQVSAGSSPVKVEIKLAPLNSIRGRVFGPDGKPAAGIEVSLIPNVMANEAVTGEDGRFTLENSRPGSYTLIARPPGNPRPQAPGEGDRNAMVATYYPSVADKSLAQPVVFGGQEGFGELEIRMQTARVQRVRGIVLDEEGKPVPGAELSLLPPSENTSGPRGMFVRVGAPSFFLLGARGEPGGAPEASTAAGGTGRFEFSAVRSGNWRILAEDPGRGMARGVADVSVSRGDVDDLEIRVAKPFKFTGTVEWKNSQPASSAQLAGVVTLTNPAGNEIARSGPVESGGMSFENILPGRYQALIKPGLAAQVFLGEYEVTGQTFSVTGDGPRLRVIFRTWAGSVRGTVEKGEGATVLLIPQRYDGVAFGQSIVCGPGGTFEMTEVSPGDYYIAAFDRMDGPSPSAVMLSLVPARGTSVKVEERLATGVMLSLIALPR